jgi:peptidyl-prolyl cis-trans isomerase SurA
MGDGYRPVTQGVQDGQKIRVTMTFRISQIAAVCGLSLLTMPGAMYAQAPRYQSPGTPIPAAPQPQPATLPVPTAITPNGVVVEDMIVRVNDQIISRSDLERSQQQLAQEMQQNNVPAAEAAEQEKNLLRDMIDKQLMLSRAKELGLNADAEVIRRLDEIRKQNNMGSMDDLEKAARQQGISFEDFKANIRDGILEQQVVRDEVGRRLQMTQGQEQTYYDAHKQDFTQPEQIRLSEILIPTTADATDAAVAQALAKANDVAAQIKAGAKFEDLAKKDSGGPTAAQGGDLGLFKRGALAKVLEDQTFGLAAGQSTEPIRTRQGFVILKVTEHQVAGVQPLKDVEPQVQEAMYMEQLQPAMRTYLTKLREDAYIDIKPGFVDTGASPRQTKPIMTAYTAPVPKKKVVVEKQRFDRGTRFSTAEPKETASAAAPPATGTPAAAGTAGTAMSSAAGSPVVAPDATPTTPSPAATAKTVSSAKVATSGKQKKIKREKVRFGQAPRNSLPSSPTDTLTDKGLGLSAAEGPGGAAAPGASMAPAESTTTFTATSDPDPLTPKVASEGKTRYAARAKTEAATKAANKTAKVQEKAKATPTVATSEEKLSEKTQAAPLGLNGDTAKKKKKEKTKDTPKERIQDKPKEPAAPAPEPMPYRPPPPTTPGSAPAATPPANTTPAAPAAPSN